jgi:uncharacterized membrane protein
VEVVESAAIVTIQWIKLILEVAGALFVGLGAAIATGHFVRALASAGPVRFTPVRLTFAKYLSLALEFQLGADILGTTIAPSWEQIGKLGAIAVIRTTLNYFLGREMKEEKEAMAAEGAVDHGLTDRRARASSSARD